MTLPSSSSSLAHPHLSKAKRLPLSSASSQHNKPRTPSNSSKPRPTSKPAQVVRSSRSNPSLPRAPPPALSSFQTSSSTSTASFIPTSPSYPLDSNSASSLSLVAAPPRETFAAEVFVHAHSRAFPHLHVVQKPLVVRRDTPASAISSEEASVVGEPLPSLEREEKELVEERKEEDETTSTPRRKVRPLSLVALQSSGGLFDSPMEKPVVRSRPVSLVERMVERERERESLDLDRRSSDEISSECDLDLVCDHTPPPRTRAASPGLLNASSSRAPPPAFKVSPVGVKFAASTTGGAHQAFCRPPTPISALSPSASASFSQFPAHFTSLPPTPDSPFYPFHSPPPSSRRPPPTSHRRGSSITYRRSSTALVSPPLSSALFPIPSNPEFSGGMSTSASNSTMTSSGSIRVPRRMTSVEMERELFWHPRMAATEELGPMSEEEEAVEGLEYLGLAPEAGPLVKGKERDEAERPGIGGAKKLGSSSSLVRKSASEGAGGMRERYQLEREEKAASVYSVPHTPTTPNTPNSPYGFVHNPTPPFLQFSAPASDAGSTRYSWRDWFGSSSRRGSTSNKQDALERGEGEGVAALRPGWLRKGSLPLPSPAFSFASSGGSGSGSSFGNAPGEIWLPSSPSLDSYSPTTSAGTFGPSSPQQSFSPSFPSSPSARSDVRLPPQAVIIRRPLVSTSANATLAGLPKPLHRGLKPLELTLPPKPLKKRGGLLSSRLPLATIAGSPSKKDLEEGRGEGPSVEENDEVSRARTRSAPARVSFEENDENDVVVPVHPQPLRGYHLQHSTSPVATPTRLRTRSEQPAFALAVHPSTPLRHPSPPSPSQGKSVDLIPNHRRTYSTATSTTFSPTRDSISFRVPHGSNVLNSSPGSGPSTIVGLPTSQSRRQSVLTFRDEGDASFSDGPTMISTAINATESTGPNPPFASSSAGGKRGDARHSMLTRPGSRISVATVYERVVNAPRHWLDEALPSQMCFLAGFLLGPWVWILGGWGLSADGRFILSQLQGGRPSGRHLSPTAPRQGSSSAHRSSFASDRSRSSSVGQAFGIWLSGGGVTANSQHEQQFELQPQLSGYESLKIGGEKKRKRWLLPVLRSEGKDKWVWRCRVAAILSGCVLLPGVVLAVVFAVL